MKAISCPNCTEKNKIIVRGTYEAEIIEVIGKDMKIKMNNKKLNHLVITENLNFRPFSYYCMECKEEWDINIDDFIL